MLIFFNKKTVFDVDFLNFDKSAKDFFCDFFRRIQVIGNNYAHGFIRRNASEIKINFEIDDER